MAVHLFDCTQAAITTFLTFYSEILFTHCGGVLGQHPGTSMQHQRPAISPGMDQMASAYGLLQPQGTQAQQQAPGWSWAPPPQTGGWGAGSSSAAHPYMDPSGYSDPPGFAMPQSSGLERSAQHGQHGQSAGAVPDAMQHLLSAAEAASTKRK